MRYDWKALRDLYARADDELSLETLAAGAWGFPRRATSSSGDGQIGRQNARRHGSSWQKAGRGSWMKSMAAGSKVRMSVEGEKRDRSWYRAEVHPVLVPYFAQEGLTDEQIASKRHVNRSTLNTWRKRYPERATAPKFGKEQAGAQVVMSLYQQALKGNMTAQIFWCLNRMPDKWRNRREVEAQIATPAGKGMSVDEITQRYAEAVKGSSREIRAAHLQKGGRTITGVLVFRYGKEEVTVLPETMVVEEGQGDECASGERS
jgi:transposase